MKRPMILWGLSALLLAWIGAMSVWAGLNAACGREGQRFSLKEWACVPVGPQIILQRDLRRG